jgi:hypothetical protein
MTLRLWILRSLSLLASLLLVLVYHDMSLSFSLSFRLLSLILGGLSGIHASGAAFDGLVFFTYSPRVLSLFLQSINQFLLPCKQIFHPRTKRKSQFDCTFCKSE